MKKKSDAMKKNKKSKKNKKVGILVLLSVIIIAALVTLIYSAYQIYSWNDDNNKIDNQMEKVEEVVEVKEVKDTENVELVNPVENKKDPYWDYIKLSLIDVDFSELKSINSETVGWIQVLGTNVNYPFVQTVDNKYYLTHQLDKKYNSAGWVFMDYRNNAYDFNDNTIIYAHGRLNRTMFGSLRNVIKDSWYKNKDNHIVKISTETENTLWQVFSTYKIKTTSDYLQIDFLNPDDRLSFYNMLKQRSIYNYGVELFSSDKIITLSTCHNDEEKIVLHAKMIKKEKKLNSN